MSERNLSPAENYPIIGQCRRCGRDLQESDNYTSEDLIVGPFLCEACDENPREKGDDDGVEYGDPRDHRDGRE